MKILVVSGASGGHIFPALSFLEALEEKYEGTHALLVLPERSKRAAKIASNGIEVKYISICPLKLEFSRDSFHYLIRLFKGILESLFIIIKFRPDIVVGFGGIESVPLVLFAWFFRIKTLLHEQNVIPGEANKLLAKFVDKAAISFEESRGLLKISQDRVVWTGNPLRKELRICPTRSTALNFFGFEEGKFNLLVVGGSQGSRKINACFLEATADLIDKPKLQVIHISGIQDYALLADSYKDIDIKIKLFSFLKEMQYAYSICDLVISRAGATTISELLYFKIPALLIPYPFSRQHQTANALFLKRTGLAIVINDNELTAQVLKDKLCEFILNPGKLKLMRLGFEPISKINASDALVDAAVSIVIG
ncbi:MAG: UDP-N-acetylglucosamine--N-acetylmuramyl-(pentapeptide) pyrophosphoryl-undecaprenol N-acetylglucosamine transferase [Candidatus Omnitrophota bacterium]|nr:UDP-N-acetylglucosamine--N-acetylmuramyl-(pentapeptide) pyrophosphoryl-undecaprenol N-acetylglucosamine transferase [Candidatus Omnitrophota bacterium]